LSSVPQRRSSVVARLYSLARVVDSSSSRYLYARLVFIRCRVTTFSREGMKNLASISIVSHLKGADYAQARTNSELERSAHATQILGLMSMAVFPCQSLTKAKLTAGTLSSATCQY